VCILIGDNHDSYLEAQIAILNGIPLIVVKGSDLCNEICMSDEEKKRDDQNYLDQKKQQEKFMSYGEQKVKNPVKEIDPQIMKKLREARTFQCPDSSEDLASLVRLLLTVTI